MEIECCSIFFFLMSSWICVCVVFELSGSCGVRREKKEGPDIRRVVRPPIL